MDVFNSNGQAYENDWDLPQSFCSAQFAVPQAVEEGRDVRAGVLRYLDSELFM